MPLPQSPNLPVSRAVFLVLLLLLTACSSAPAQQTAVPQQDRTRSLLSRLARVEERIPAAERYGPGLLAQARLALRKAAGTPSYWTDTPDYFGKSLDEADKAITLLEQGKRRVEPAIGFQERAYISPTDGSPEPYLVYVPAAYDAKRPCPLLIFLHGYTSTLDPANWIDIQYSPSLQEACEQEGVILLVPFGRRNTEFMGIGESDVLEAIECVRREYNVDPRRIILSGASMGGSGAYSIACHYPDRFAAVIGLCGRADYYLWMNVEKGSLPQFKQAQMDADYARELLPNLRHVPVLIFHGGQDHLVSIAQSQQLESRLKALGQPVQFFEIPDAGHNDVWTPSFNHPAFRETLRAARLKEAPASFTYRTMTLKYPGAYWAKIESLLTWGRMAELSATVTGPNAIDLRVENISQLTLGPSIPSITAAAPLKLTLNGQPVTSTRRADGTLLISAGPAPEPGGKSSSICGPIREAFNGPFLIVYPSDATLPGAMQDRENATRLLLEWAGCAVMNLPNADNELQAALGNWDAFNLGPLPVRSDRQVTEQEIASFNLVLCGTPATNTIFARIADKLPLKIEAGEYRIGAHRFPMKDTGVECIYPNPLNPNRYVLIVHGVPWGPQLSFNHKLDFQPDFVLFAKESVEDNTLFPTNRVLCAGYFDQRWRLSPDSTWLPAGTAPVLRGGGGQAPFPNDRKRSQSPNTPPQDQRSTPAALLR